MTEHMVKVKPGDVVYVQFPERSKNLPVYEVRLGDFDGFTVHEVSITRKGETVESWIGNFKDNRFSLGVV